KGWIWEITVTVNRVCLTSWEDEMRVRICNKLVGVVMVSAVSMAAAQAQVVFSGVSSTSDDYALGVVWSSLARDKGIDMTVVENGTVAGMRKTALGEVDLVAVGSPHYRDAVNGEGAYAKDPANIREKYQDMKAIMGLPSGMAQYVVNAN